MYWILMVMALVVSIVIAVVVGGLATPRKHVASRAVVLGARPEVVWQIVRDVAKYAEWRSDIQSVHLDTGNSGAMRWTELGDGKSVSYEAVLDDPPARFTARITDMDLSYSGEWQYVLHLDYNGTRLVIAEHGEVGNPVFRFFGTHFFGFTKRMDRYLEDLARHLREDAKPESVNA